MKFSKGTLGKVAAIAVAASVSSFAVAGTLTTPVSATGTITAAPQWQDGANAAISSFAFDFSGVAGTVAAADVDSSAISAKLVNMTALNTVNVATPSGCSIGGSNVSAGDVKVLVNGTAVADGGSFTPTVNVVQPYKLRFAAAGNYGTLSGLVTCSTPGSFVYGY